MPSPCPVTEGIEAWRGRSREWRWRASSLWAGPALRRRGGSVLAPDSLGHPADSTNVWTRIRVVFAEHVLDALPERCAPVALGRVWCG